MWLYRCWVWRDQNRYYLGCVSCAPIYIHQSWYIIRNLWCWRRCWCTVCWGRTCPHWDYKVVYYIHDIHLVKTHVPNIQMIETRQFWHLFDRKKRQFIIAIVTSLHDIKIDPHRLKYDVRKYIASITPKLFKYCIFVGIALKTQSTKWCNYEYAIWRKSYGNWYGVKFGEGRAE